MGSGDTRTEQMLYVLGNGGTSSQFNGCCNTKGQTYLLDAIDRMNRLETYETFTFTLLDGTIVEKDIRIKPEGE